MHTVEREISNKIAAAAHDRTTRGLAATVRELIQGGVFPPGTRLPTVRVLAADLHVSASTVSEAWQTLAREGRIHTAGRNGTVVLRVRKVQTTERSSKLNWIVGQHGLDLAAGTPDSRLLPVMTGALAGIDKVTVQNYVVATVLPGLEDFLRESWAPSLRPESVSLMHGAMDAVDRLLPSLIRVGDRVAVADPSLPTIIDLIEAHGGVPVPLTQDDSGVQPESLATALLTRPRVVFLEPRAQNPTGASTTWVRAERLASMLRGTKVIVIEDDHCGMVSTSPLASLMQWLPDQVILIQSFSKSHGPDLRLAAVGGPDHLLRPAETRRRLGGGWESWLLQRILLHMLTDPDAVHAVDVARETYAQRRADMVRACAARGLRTWGSDGLLLWVEVDNEAAAMRRLAAHDVGVSPGSSLKWENKEGHHVRLTTALLPGGYDTVAELLAGTPALESPGQHTA